MVCAWPVTHAAPLARRPLAPLTVATVAAAVLATLAAVPPQARAYERELSLGIEAGFAQAFGPGLPGARAGLHASYGLDDTWTVAAQLGYSFHPADEPLHVGEVAAELLYVIDVVRVVPYFGVGLSWFGTLRAGELGGDGGAHLVAGGHYYLSRSWAIGLDVRGHTIFTAIEDFPVYLTATLRLSFVQAL